MLTNMCRVWLIVLKRDQKGLWAKGGIAMLEDGAASAVSVAFKQHLAALNGEFERLVMENVDLRKQLVSGNGMPSVLSSPCSPSSSCSPTQAPAVSSSPDVLEGQEVLWQVRSLEACSLKLSAKVKKGVIVYLKTWFAGR